MLIIVCKNTTFTKNSDLFRHLNMTEYSLVKCWLKSFNV